jgi:pimeloyl-ACP methyl ester carboxylesterase/DNA-binding CsgD family transcriptional regulator
VKLAWAEAGEGPIMIKAANWLTHLEDEWESPVWQHWIRFFADNFRFLRYDERGCGMTDWNVGDLSFERWVEDLEAVVAAAAPSEPFALLGISQGAAVCIAYAVRYPERVSRLILYGGYARGWRSRGQPEGEREYQAIVDLARVGWGRYNPAFRRVFTSRFIPGDEEQLGAARAFLLQATQQIWRDIAPAGKALTLDHRMTLRMASTHAIHAAREDAICPVAEGRLLASGIPGAEFVELDSKNHILLDGEPAWDRFRQAVQEFMGLAATPGVEDPAFLTLSSRERQILLLLTEGLANAQIAARLSVSEKTVRNHVSNLFDKLGVWTRAQAMVFARDRGFRG